MNGPSRTRLAPAAATLRLAVLVVALGLIASGVLERRQARLQAAHELAAALDRVRKLDDEALRLRAELVRRAGEAIDEAAPAPFDLREPMTLTVR